MSGKKGGRSHVGYLPGSFHPYTIYHLPPISFSTCHRPPTTYLKRNGKVVGGRAHRAGTSRYRRIHRSSRTAHPESDARARARGKPLPAPHRHAAASGGGRKIR